MCGNFNSLTCRVYNNRVTVIVVSSIDGSSDAKARAAAVLLSIKSDRTRTAKTIFHSIANLTCQLANSERHELLTIIFQVHDLGHSSFGFYSLGG